MKHIVTSLIILAICGCRTAKHTCPVDPQTQKVTVSVTPCDRSGNALDTISGESILTFKLAVTKTSGVAKSSTITLNRNQWATLDIDIDIFGLEQIATLQVDDEAFEIDCSPGFHVKVIAIPLDESRVRLKGAYVDSDINERNLMKPKEIMAFNLIAEAGKTNTLYELETKFGQYNRKILPKAANID